MDTDDSVDGISSASSVDFEDPADWITAKVHEAGLESKTSVLTYRFRSFIAKGNFGCISRILTTERKTYALKRVDCRGRHAMQEVQMMLSLEHPNLVRIKYYYKESFDKNHVRVFLIMEFVPRSLVEHIISRFDKKRKFAHLELALILYQILRGLEYMHRRNIAHRDIKPHNILIDVEEQIVKICDFGSAKDLLDTKTPNATYVCSRWYRAPELLQQNAAYTTKVDIWSCGCVLAELITLHPFFCGADTVDQWACIRDVLGSPSEGEMRAIGIRPSLNDYHVKRKDLNTVFGVATPQVVINFFEQLVQYAQQLRPTAWRALAHPMFDALRTHEVSSTYPHLFNFSDEELTYEPEIKKIFPA